MSARSEDIEKIASEIRDELLNAQNERIDQKFDELKEKGELTLTASIGLYFHESQQFATEFTTRLIQRLSETSSDQ